MPDAEPCITLSEALLEQAAQWHVRMQSDEVTAADKAAFEHWLQVKEHTLAYQRMQAVWGQFDEVASPVAATALQRSLNDARQRRARRATMGSALGVLLLGAWLTWQAMTPGASWVNNLLADYRTTVGEQRAVRLPDGSQLRLNTASAVNIDYSDHLRRIELLQGEIQLQVAKDAQRPLLVSTRQGQVSALGTAFSVREYVLDQQSVTEVKVTESRVRACVDQHSSETTERCETLQAGEQTRMSAQSVEAPQRMNTGLQQDWGQQQLVVDNQPLLVVLDELARYQAGYWSLDRGALAEYRVSGVFPLDDIPRSLQVIALSLPLQVEHYTPWWTRISAAAEASTARVQ